MCALRRSGFDQGRVTFHPTAGNAAWPVTRVGDGPSAHAALPTRRQVEVVVVRPQQRTARSRETDSRDEQADPGRHVARHERVCEPAHGQRDAHPGRRRVAAPHREAEQQEADRDAEEEEQRAHERDRALHHRAFELGQGAEVELDTSPRASPESRCPRRSRTRRGTPSARSGHRPSSAAAPPGGTPRRRRTPPAR